MNPLATAPSLVDEITNVLEATHTSGSAASIIASLRGASLDVPLEAAMSAFLQNASAQLILRICADKDDDLSKAIGYAGQVAALTNRLEIKRRDTVKVELLYELIPADFPRLGSGYSLPGVQSKVALVEYAGKLYEAGLSPPEIVRRWYAFEDLAQQFATRSLEVEHGKYGHLNRQEILSQYLARLLTKSQWGSPEELTWVIVRTASILRWPFMTMAI